MYTHVSAFPLLISVPVMCTQPQRKQREFLSQIHHQLLSDNDEFHEKNMMKWPLSINMTDKHPLKFVSFVSNWQKNDEIDFKRKTKNFLTNNKVTSVCTVFIFIYMYYEVDKEKDKIKISINTYIFMKINILHILNMHAWKFHFILYNIIC